MLITKLNEKMTVKEKDIYMCPTCGKECELRDGMFYLDGVFFSGWVCVPCNALFVNEADSIFNYNKDKGEKQ